MEVITITATTLGGIEIVESHPIDGKVGDLKDKIAGKLEEDKVLLSLICNCDLLNDDNSLRDEGISADCNLTLVTKTPPELSDFEDRHRYWCIKDRIAFQQPIHTASGTNNVDTLLAELEKGVEPSLSGRDSETPLHHAARLGCLDTAMLLVERGANVHARNSFSNTVLQYSCFRHPFDEDDHGGVAKDTIACMMNRSAMLILLILAGADVSAGGDGGTTADQRLGRRDTGASLVLRNRNTIYANGLANKDQLHLLLEQAPELRAVRASFTLLLERHAGAGYAWAARIAEKRVERD